MCGVVDFEAKVAKGIGRGFKLSVMGQKHKTPSMAATSKPAAIATAAGDGFKHDDDDDSDSDELEQLDDSWNALGDIVTPGARLAKPDMRR